ncbi:MAG: YidC/Oxa1 family membrane protein insertase, partial [Glaciecola sp.]
MDIQRTLLIGAIMLLSFMLLTEWVNFQDIKAEVVSTETRLTASPGVQPGSANGDLPADLPAPLPNNGSTLPPTNGVEDIPAVGASVDTAAPMVTATENIVQIYTDSLQVAIDLNGGDIVEVALAKFLAEIDDPETPFVLLENNSRRVYVAQSGLIGRDGIDSKSRANYRSTQSRYDMGVADTLEVDLQWSNDAGISVTKRFSFQRDSYVVDVEFIINNQSDARWQGNLFGQIKRDSSAADSGGGGGMGMQPFLGAATTTADDRFEKFSFDDMLKEPFREQNAGGWIAMIQHYFLSAWVPAPEQTHTYSTRVTNSGFNIAGFTSPAITVDPGTTQEVSARFYAGPKDQYSL